MPHVCSSLSVVSSRIGKKHLLLNLCYLYQFLQKDEFKYEDLRVAMLMFEKVDFVFL